MKKRKLFVTFEGGEGSGKTTQIRRLAKRLEKEKYAHVVTREPGGTSIGEKIRKITHNPDNAELCDIAEAYLMVAARAQHVHEVIKPALKAKKIVICDRFLDSTLAYQGIGRGLGVEQMEELNKLAVDKLEPDVTVYLDITPKQGIKRKLESRGKPDRLDQQKDDFYIKIYRGYRKLIQKSSGRFFVLDAESELNVLEEKIWNAVYEKLESKVK